MTLRYLSSDGSTVRSSRLGSRMTMTSYARKAVSTSSGLGGHGLSVAGGLCLRSPPMGGRRDRLTTRDAVPRIVVARAGTRTPEVAGCGAAVAQGVAGHGNADQRSQLRQLGVSS